jgi:DNA (cytosine-5)-methyltransferase 1
MDRTLPLLKKRHETLPRGTAKLPPLRCAGLFAGIAGIELGLHIAGHTTELLCEIDEGAKAVLAAHFPSSVLRGDIRELVALPTVDLVSAGFPCQDLSQAGRTAGISGTQSGLVGQLFRLLENSKAEPRWLLLENVPFMLQLDRGQAMKFLTQWLDQNGYDWAYRTVNTQAFGLPQRRQRVLLLASRTADPREILLVDDAVVPPAIEPKNSACGFYWTEGNTGLGWAVDAVPTLKGGSTIGIPSPPGIWMRHSDGSIQIPDIRDAERLQGFPKDWTLPATLNSKHKKGARWKLVGNAVSVPVAKWLGDCLRNPRAYDDAGDARLQEGNRWPSAAWGKDGEIYSADVSLWPVSTKYHHLADFLEFSTTPLSARATAGFLGRARESCLRNRPPITSRFHAGSGIAR